MHAESVVVNENKEVEVVLCENCYDVLKSGKIPEKAIAKGFDFGRPDRITPALEPLELIERFAISSMVPYITLFKITPGVGAL